MTVTDEDSGPASASASDRRRFKRVAVHLPGRYMLEDGTEYPCVCIDISVVGVRLRAAHAGPWGSRVIAYIESIGRIEGYIVRRAPGWFALESRITPRKGERVQERIAWVAETEFADSPDRRGLEREVGRRVVTLSTRDGHRHAAELTDITKEGAALLTEAALDIDECVRLDRRYARVLRVFPGGVALKFENWSEDAMPRRAAAG